MNNTQKLIANIIIFAGIVLGGIGSYAFALDSGIQNTALLVLATLAGTIFLAAPAILAIYYSIQFALLLIWSVTIPFKYLYEWRSRPNWEEEQNP